jgi:hypothetical protein
MSENVLDIAGDIVRRAKIVQKNEAQIGVYSTGEAIAIALVLNRPDLLPSSYSHVLEAVDRLGEDWLRAAKIAHRTLFR